VSTLVPYSQRDPLWAGHTLGWNHPGTIGAYGCVVTVKAMIATFAGYPITPPKLNDAFVLKKIFTQDPTGTYDFLPDNALALLWPTRFAHVGSYAGLRNDLISAALPTPNLYAEAHIHSATVPTHRVWIIGGINGDWTILDPWDKRVKKLSAYGGPSAISKTIITKELPQPVTVKPAPVPVVAPPIDPAPIVVASPVPPEVIPTQPTVTPPETYSPPAPPELFWRYLILFLKWLTSQVNK